MIRRSAYGQNFMAVVLDYSDYVFVQTFSPGIENQGSPVLSRKNQLNVDLRVGVVPHRFHNGLICLCDNCFSSFALSLKGRLRGTVMFPVLPSSRPYRDVEHGRRLPSTELWPLTGLFATGTDLQRRVQRGGMFHRRNSPVRRNDHDGRLVPQGHKLGRNGVPDRPPMPLQGRDMSRRDTNPVEGRHQADTLSRRDTSSVETEPSDGPHTPLQGRNLTASPNCPGPDSGN